MTRLLEILLEGLLFLRNYAFFPGDGETFSLLRITSLFIAFSISGAVVVFMSQGAVLKFFGPNANKVAAYLVASISGAILAVCSCSVLPMFASIRKKGAGLGPAIAFLFSGPAINILAITLTFTDLGVDMGLVRVIAAINLALFIGIIMHLIFRKSEVRDTSNNPFAAIPAQVAMPLWQRGLFFLTLIFILLFGVYRPLFTGVFIGLLILQLVLWFQKDDLIEWAKATGDLAKKILPLFVVGIFLAGVLQAIVTTETLSSLVGDNTYQANVFASMIGAVMYFATMTEIPILRSLIDLGMNKGPATALLLAGPTLSLPNMIVIGRVLGLKRSSVYIMLVIVLAALAGFLAGLWIY